MTVCVWHMLPTYSVLSPTLYPVDSESGPNTCNIPQKWNCLDTIICIKCVINQVCVNVGSY